ncbi:FAD-binding monooxygenase [Sphingomonas turrisvirgatae]|uniref:Phenol 2-monooxygenase n=1 Tax=Sphingomonas turrisvirgatae TaxID=1888892 RepID=A0A1E3LTY2_9SPHN|nr:FAD-binding monooxygenase [Sphingomonas turrisvirgatae]ODP37174.1 phenol 2-monooxygenase [Sphingomonas turrisvirgatae]
MQFYVDGFYPGDPFVSPPAPGGSHGAGDAAVPTELDVLIVGCGPTGLTLAAQLSAFPDIRCAIVERKPGPLEIGQADGIACRSVEMYQAFGFAERVLKEAYWVNETAFWRPDPADRSHIARSGRIQDTEDGLSEFPHLILNQARIHDFLLEVMRNAPTRLEPHYQRQLVELTIDRAGSPDYPVAASFQTAAGEIERVRARYVVGCDGARSFVRGAIGRELRGDSANQAWGVMDVLAVTDFPDIRLKAAIHSAEEGNVLIIPREGGHLVRFYIELDKLAAGERIASRNITTDHLIAAAQRVLHPYTLDVKEVAWWSVYEIGQRICDKFDDVPDGSEDAMLPCAFIAGDACHTHSPKAGQGMNVSIADGFNLGWKLAAVLRGQSKPELLHSYSLERRAIAQELIDFDRDFARMFSARPKDSGEAGDGVDPAEFQRYFVKHGRFTAGTSVHYQPSAIVAVDQHQALASGFTIGMRFHSAPVVRLADAKPMHLGHALRADGRWRVIAFAPAQDPTAPSGDLAQLCDFLAAHPHSPVVRYTPSGATPDSVIETLAVLQQNHRDIAIGAMPAFLLPATGRYGLRDYEKIFCPDLKDGPDIFDLRGIDREYGCLIVVRPDQFVAQILPFDDHQGLAGFFDAFMQPAG